MRKVATPALLFAMFPFTAIAGPPAVGTVNYVFTDPAMHGVVLCDTEDQLKEIVGAPVPNDVYQHYLDTPNAQHENTCLAGSFVANVISFESVGILRMGGSYHAWAVQVAHGSERYWAPWLEKFGEQSV